MAKDKTTTTASAAASKVAAGVLNANPGINEVHITSDGTAFYTRDDAQNHADTLKNREVFSHKRDSAATRTMKAGTPDNPNLETPDTDE